MEAASVVLVTNVGQGFGRAVALAFGASGSDVVCADPDVDLASKTAAEIEEKGGQAIPIQADMSTQMDVVNAFTKVFEIFGALDGVVHVITQESHTPFLELGEGEFAELILEDLRSTFLTLKIAGRMIDDGWLVLVAPPASADQPQMRAVQGAVVQLVRSFASAIGLRTNLVVPSRAPSDPRHDAPLVDTVRHLGSRAASGVSGHEISVTLPPPPRVVESLLPEVQAALDASVRQDDLEASHYDDEDDGDDDAPPRGGDHDDEDDGEFDDRGEFDDEREDDDTSDDGSEEAEEAVYARAEADASSSLDVAMAQLRRGRSRGS